MSLGFLVALSLGIGLWHCADSADSDRRTLTILAPAAPGGGWDQTARAMQQVLRVTEVGSVRASFERSGCRWSHRTGTIGKKPTRVIPIF